MNEVQPPNALTVRRTRVAQMEGQIKLMLPTHLPWSKFQRSVNTALMVNPDLQKCTEQSFMTAIMRAAQDGLLPDGYECALVPFKSDGQLLAQYIPMIAGIRKKVRQSGVLVDWNVQVVQEGDEFTFQLGDDPFIKHIPAETGGRARRVRFAYSIARYPDGTLSREVMNADQIEDIRKKSKAKYGPWSDPIYYPEMCRKTVARLHAKQLPMSSDLEVLWRREDELYGTVGTKEPRQAVRGPTSVRDALDRFSSAAPTPALATPPVDNVPEPIDPPELNDEPIDTASQPHVDSHDNDAGSPPAVGHDKPESHGTAAGGGPDPIREAYARGQDARLKGHKRTALPGEYRTADRAKEATAWDRGFSGEPLE